MLVAITVSISIVLFVEIRPKISVVETGTTGSGDTACVGSGAAADKSTVDSALVTNFLLIQGGLLLMQQQLHL